MSSSRSVLFYSEYCTFSKEVLNLVTKKNASTLFLLVCVDSYRSQLPAFVRSVPTILTHDRRVLEGDSALAFVDMIQGVHPPGQLAQGKGRRSPQPQGTDADGPMESSMMTSAWSESYSFLEPSDNDRSELGAFSGLTDDNNIRCVPESNDRKGGGGSSARENVQAATPYSNYLANRDSDTEVLRSHQLSKSSTQGLQRR